MTGVSVIFPYTEAFGNYRLPYEVSLRYFEPELQILPVCTDNPDRIRNYGRIGYTAALNEGASKATGEWLLFSNDDILCVGKFARMVEGLDPNFIYGLELRHKSKSDWGADVDYVYGWIMLMHRDLYAAVGPHDEFYRHAGFDDIDYCYRAQQRGFEISEAPLPFLHLADQPGGYHRRYKVKGYQTQMTRAKQHFLRKVKP